jgi:hypothetical protein
VNLKQKEGNKKELSFKSPPLAMNSLTLFKTFAIDFQENFTLEKNKLIEEYINKGFSIIPINDNKLPLISWKQYQNKQPEAYEIYNWYFNYPGFNIGIITGGISNFYSLDFDNFESFRSFPDEYKNSALTETRKGLHLNFLSKSSYPGKILNINDYKVEFKGQGQFVIEPPSIINGFEYKSINPLSKIKDLPNFITDLLERERENREKEKDKEKEKIVNWQFKGTQGCIKQILNRELIEGERERSLFTLYNLLVKSNDIKYAQYLVVKKNELLKDPLKEVEVLNIFKQTSYNKIGCLYIRGNLPWISCKGCQYFKEATMDFRDVYYSKSLTDKDKKVYFELKVMDTKTKEEIARHIEISRMQVYLSIEKLKKEGFL